MWMGTVLQTFRIVSAFSYIYLYILSGASDATSINVGYFSWLSLSYITFLFRIIMTELGIQGCEVKGIFLHL